MPPDNERRQPPPEERDEAVERHDERTRELGIWLGAEPTFTDRTAESPEWLSEALGDDKRLRARQLLKKLRDEAPGAVVLRPLGRQYAGEPEPRFCYGLYARRDGQALWSGPPDRLLDGTPTTSGSPGTEAPQATLLLSLRAALAGALRAAGWSTLTVDAPSMRLVCRADGATLAPDLTHDPRVQRESIHGRAIEGAGLVDELAADGYYLVLLHAGSAELDHNACWLELPAFATVADFATFLRALGTAANQAQLSSLGLRGFAPPVNASVAWTTVTPDPAVIEINQAPQPTLRDFQLAEARLFRLASAVGLSPYRLQYNGEVSDSGGGGQLTFGGASPEQSPFFTCPALLPRLIRYVIRHPCLSYWFATPYVGASSQSPRADENVREAFIELEVALEQLARVTSPTPQILWSTLRHFMADASGNPHRSELNIEKLDNPFLPGRGRLGLVELRALKMAESLDDDVARAMLLRGVLAMLMREDRVPKLVHWGDELHDRFALPFYLRRDLTEVFADLERVGLGCGAAVETRLLQRSRGVLCDTDFAGHRVRVQQAVEFWPLVGDVASQEGGGSRLVDASTTRLQVSIEAGPKQDTGLEALELAVNGIRVPLRTEHEATGATRLLGLRYRSYVPWTGMHPTILAEPQLSLTLRSPASSKALRVALHPWRPTGGAYDGLPKDLTEAEARRMERAVVERFDAAELPPPREPTPQAATPYCLDLRRVPKPPSAQN